MNKKLLFTLLLTGTTSVGHATDEARLLRFPATNGQEVVFSYAGDLYKAPLTTRGCYLSQPKQSGELFWRCDTMRQRQLPIT